MEGRVDTTQTVDVSPLSIRRKGPLSLRCSEGTFYPADVDLLATAPRLAARKRLTRGTYRGNGDDAVPAVAIAFGENDVADFAMEVAALAELQRIEVGPRLLDVVRADDTPDRRPTLIEEDVGTSLQEAVLDSREIPLVGDGPQPDGPQSVAPQPSGVILAPVGTRERELQNAKLLLDVFDQVRRMHEAGCYHGDLKLSNVCVRARGTRPQDLQATVIDIERRLSSPDEPPSRLTPLYLEAMFFELPSALGHAERIDRDVPPVLQYDLACLEAIRFELVRGVPVATPDGSGFCLGMDEAYLRERFVSRRSHPVFAYDKHGRPRVRAVRRGRDLSPLARELGMQLEGARRRRSAAAGIAFVAALVLVMGVALAHYALQPLSDASESWMAGQSGWTIVTLSAEDDLSYASVKECIEALRARLDNCLGAGTYRMVTDVDKVTLSLPSDAFGEESLQDALKYYLTRPLEPYAYNQDVGIFDIEPVRKDALHLEREQIVGVTTDDDGTTAVQLDEETYDAVVRLREETGCLRLYFDIWSNSYIRYADLELDDDAHAIVIAANAFADDQAGRRMLSNLLAFALTHDAMPGTFTADVEPYVDWHAFDEAGLSAKNRVDATEVGTEAALVTMTRDDADESFQDEDMLDVMNVVCARLDAMGMPYALGRSEDDASSFAVLLPLAYGGLPMAGLLESTQTDARIHVGLTTYAVESVRLGNSLKGNALVCDVDADQLAALRKDLKQAKDTPVYLAVGNYGYPLFVAKTTDLAGQDDLSFDTTCFAAGDQAWLFSLVDAVANGDKMPSGTRMTATVAPRDILEGDHVLALGMSYDTQLDDLLARAKEVAPDARVSSGGGSSARVFLHLDVDETLPEQGLALVERIYRDVDFEHGVFDGLCFYLCDTRSDERAFVSFDKSTEPVTDDDEPYVSLYLSLRGGRLERYKEDFSEHVFASEFYQSFYSEDTMRFCLE